RADHGTGTVPMILECLGDRMELQIERWTSEILHTVLKRISSCQNHGMRWPSQRHLRDRSVEDDSIATERIEGWSFHILRSVTTDVVCADSINRYENYVRPRLLGARGSAQ